MPSPENALESLRIVHVVCTSAFAGVERYIATTSRELARRGHDVCVIGGDQRAMRKAVGSDAVAVVPGASVAATLPHLLKYARDAEVVHAHMTKAEFAVVAARPALRGRVFASRHFARRRGSSLGARLIAPLIERGIDSELAISRFVSTDTGAARVLLNAVPNAEQVALKSRVVLVAQRLEAEKRTGDALRAWKVAGLWALGWELWIAGEGSERQQLEEFAAQLPGVKFLGHRDDLDTLRSRAGIALATAPAEPFGLSVAESMAAGLPVVAAAGGGHLETAGAADPDCLYPPGDVEACAATLMRLASDLEVRQAVGRRCREFQQRELSIERHVDGLLEAYWERIARHAQAADCSSRQLDPLRVLRVYHSAVVSDWRERDRELRRHGCDVRLLGPRSWNEGGRSVEFERDGDDFVEAAKTWGRHPFLFVYSPLPLIRELRRRRLDILDVHEEPASLAAFEFRVLAWLFQRHVPIVFYGAQNIAKRYPLPFRWIERGSLERASGAHCCNADAGRIFRDKGFRGAMRVIGLGIDVAQFAPSAPPRISDQFHLGYVGRLERHKGVAVLIEAIAPVEGTYLEIYGDGPARDELESLVQRKGLAHRVTFHGFRSHGELPGVYQSLDALALPSLRTRTWMEQFGRVAVEAMASGLPVLVSDVGALPEVVGDAGVSVPAGDIAAWRQAIASIIADPCARSELGKMGIAQAQTYSWHCIAAAHLSLYREVVA